MAQSLNQRAVEIYQDTIESLMIAINHDAQVQNGVPHTQEIAFMLAVSLQLYALNKGKKIKIDPVTKMVTIE